MSVRPYFWKFMYKACREFLKQAYTCIVHEHQQFLRLMFYESYKGDIRNATACRMCELSYFFARVHVCVVNSYIQNISCTAEL